MDSTLADALKAMWPLLKTGQRSYHFYLGIAKQPVLQVFKTAAEAEPARVLAAVQKVQRGWRPTQQLVGTVQYIDRAPVFTANAARSPSRVGAEVVTKTLRALGKELADLPEVSAALRTALFEAAAPEEEPRDDASALTLDPASWRAFSKKTFSRRSAALKAIDAAFDKWKRDAAPADQLRQLGALARAIQDWLDAKEGASGRMTQVQALAVQVARERARLEALVGEDEPEERGGAMTADLYDRVKEFLPVARNNGVSFALAPNRGKPLLTFARTDLDATKARKIFEDGGAAFDASVLYVGDLTFDRGVAVFKVNEEGSKGAVNPADLKNRLIRFANTAPRKAGDVSAFKKPRIVTAEDETLAERVTVEASDRSRRSGGTFAKIKATLGALERTRDPRARDEAEAKLRGDAAAWLEKNRERGHENDARKREELWDALKVLNADQPVTSRKELKVATVELARELDELARVPDSLARMKREGLLALEGEIDRWIDKAEETADRAALIELGTLRGRVTRAIDALPVGDGEAVDVEELDRRIGTLEEAVRALASLEEGDRRTNLANAARKTAETLQQSANKAGLKPQAARIRVLAQQIDRPWSLESDLPWKPTFRLELRGAHKRAGHPESDAGYDAMDREVYAAIKDAVVEGQRIRCDDARLIVDAGYPLQQLREVNYAVFKAIHSLTPGLSGRTLVKTEPPDYADYEKIETAFANPETRAEAERRRARRVRAARELVGKPSYLGYDGRFTDERVEALKDRVETAPTNKDAVIGLLTDNPGVILGEDHSKGDSKAILVDNMEALKESGVDTLYVEHFRREEHQADLDRYLETGELSSELEAYLRIQAEKFPGAAYPHDLRGILEKAREQGLRVVGIDSMDAKADPGLKIGQHDLAAEQRASRMNAFAGQVIEEDEGRAGKYVVLLGEKHANTHEGGSSGIPGVSQLTSAPVVNFDREGKLELRTEDRNARGKRPEPGDRATLLRAFTKAPVAMSGGSFGHRMHFQMELKVPPDATGEDYDDLGVGLHTLFGAEFEWWERIEYQWSFFAEGATREEVEDKKARGEGGSLKPWGDLFQYQSTSSTGTLGPWVAALQAAKAGTLRNPAVVVINDQPAIAVNRPGRYVKRVLRFRHVVKDSYGKTVAVEATQILVIENSALAYSLYQDSLGNRLELTPGGPGTDFLEEGEDRVEFDLDADLPDEAADEVGAFLAGIADGIAEPVTDISMDAVVAAKERYASPEPVPQLVSKVTFQAYNMLPAVRPGDRYVEWPVAGGRLLVALLSGDKPRRIYATTAAASSQKSINVERGDVPRTGNSAETIPVDIPVRAYVELPVEQYL